MRNPITGKRITATISDGNSKLGKIPNVSLVPGADCLRGVPCAKASECYAFKLYAMYRSARASWKGNSLLARANPDAYFGAIDAYLERKRPRFFRWHVAGDILSQDYLAHMVDIARNHPDTKFLAFTKRHDLDYAAMPANLQVVFSMWPGLEKPAAPKGVRYAWMQDGTETRVPKTAVDCPGLCEDCGMCWSLGKIRRDVVFHKH